MKRSRWLIITLLLGAGTLVAGAQPGVQNAAQALLPIPAVRTDFAGLWPLPAPTTAPSLPPGVTPPTQTSRPRVDSYTFMGECLRPGHPVTVRGSGFGATQQHRVVLSDTEGRLVLSLRPTGWSETAFKAIIPGHPGIETKSMQYFIALQGRSGNWITNTDAFLPFCK